MERKFVMNRPIISQFFVMVLICVNSFVAFAAESDTQPDAASILSTPLKWTSSGIMVSPVSDDTHKIVSVKDPTVVYWNGLWHIYATAYSTSARIWSMVYLNFTDWSEAPKAKLTYIDANPDLRGYHCAPHLFYFTPHKKWYFIFQSQQPQYCTTDDISKPETWTAPKNFFDKLPASTPRLPIDYHIICDETHAYLFFTGDNNDFPGLGVGTRRRARSYFKNTVNLVPGNGVWQKFTHRATAGNRIFQIHISMSAKSMVIPVLSVSHWSVQVWYWPY